jgi:bifunctional UDP-N-acetylglucosamine pyrophosphorylase/glucosamine-1-phosphate N-acetyltransferase
VHVKPHCVIESSRLDPGVEIGPMAHLRPNCHLKEDVKVGNFVEIKNSVLGAGSKSAHLSYIGDADVGSKVNFGCGTIVVNYDGFEKHRTTVGDGVFIGCNANLIAPLRLNDHTFIAAGSTVTKEVPENALAVARARQTNLDGWVTKREQLAAQKKAAKAESAAKKDAKG